MPVKKKIPRSAIFLILFASLFTILLSPANAMWIDWVNCYDLIYLHKITPQSTFQIDEKLCFYGAGFNGNQYTILLKDPVNKRTRSLAVPINNGVISSIEGISLSSMEPGTYILSGLLSQYVCSNENDQPYCIPEDLSCTLWKFTDPESCLTNKSQACELDRGYHDLDSDGDGWTDECDGFPDDPTETIDIDGDGIGRNKDMDDFDNAAITIRQGHSGNNPGQNQTASQNISNEIIINESNNQSNITNNSVASGSEGDSGGSGGGSSGSSGGGSGGGSGGSAGGGGRSSGGGTGAIQDIKLKCSPEYECNYWSDCVDGFQTRSCSIINDCPGDPEETSRACVGQGLILEAVDNTEQTTETIDENPSVQSGFSLITGAVIRPIQERPGLFVSLFALLLIIVTSFLIYKYYYKK